MTTLPQMGIVLPVRGAAGSGVWDDTLDADLALIDAHNHSTGQGTAVPTAGININADLTFSGLYAPINLHRITFASIVALSGSNKSLFVNAADQELYWRTNAGTNVKLTNGASLNVAAFVGGIGGDYTAVAAAVNYDSSGLRYTFKGAAGTNWQRLACGEVRIFETETAEAVFVGLAAPGALAGSYTITLPLAAPTAGTRPVQMSTAGVLTSGDADNMQVGGTLGVTGLITATAGVTAAANQHVTVSGTGEFKHGNRVKLIMPLSGFANSNWQVGAPPTTMTSTAGAGTLFVPVDLHAGDRIKSVSYLLFGNGVTDITVTVNVNDAAMAETSIGTLTTSNQPASWSVITIDVTDTTLVANGGCSITFAANAAGIILGNIAVTYDHP